jgi:hypothetical protein
MNYIRHLSSFYEKVMDDQRLNPTHISLYHALFQFWNTNRFQNPVIIYREQTMKLSCLGSLHTYYKCLYDLHNWGYIIYKPSHSPKNGSEVYLCNFDTSSPKGDAGLDAKEEQAGCKSDTSSGTEIPSIGCKNDISIDAVLPQVRCKSDTSMDAKMHPYINNTNIKTYKEGKSQAQNPEMEIPDEEKKDKPNHVENEKAKRKKVAPKKEKVFVAPNLDEALAFFKAEQYPEVEAKKFFYHFEANGWKVGGKAPMKNWNAAAHNWMLNTSRYEPEPKPTAVKLNTRKDYGEPL